MVPLVRALMLVFAGVFAIRAAQDPFEIRPALDSAGTVLQVSVHIPPGHYLYADQFEVAKGGVVLAPLAPFPVERHPDPITGEPRDVMTAGFRADFALPPGAGDSVTVKIHYQGCNENVCFRPMTREFTLAPGGSMSSPATDAPGPSADGAARSNEAFTVTGQATGYMGADRFIEFLQTARAASGPSAASDSSRLLRHGWLAAVVLIVLGGLSLNLTPCVLPMVPINLAIIGAGTHAGRRGRGFLLGGCYGLGIALAYGVLGLVVVLTGSRFGTLNASPWFNLGIAVLFVAMGLAMFDVIQIDLSRFQSGRPGQAPGRTGIVSALLLGAVSALLAGACVAPAVISVLVLAAEVYGRSGNPLGLLLPFLLGVGMALPWPFAGAGLSVLPKPGRWMSGIKYALGVFILLMALYYGREGVRAFSHRAAAPESAGAEIRSEGWYTSLPDALEEAARTGQPVFIDFWASWCKNCVAMDQTTFRSVEVRRELQGFVKAKFQAEDPNAPSVRVVLDRYGVMGLPTYVVLKRVE